MTISSSVVFYQNSREDVYTVVRALLECGLCSDVFIIDNSPEPVRLDSSLTSRIEYIKPSRNIGFGAAHNLALRKSLDRGCQYHLVINPDVHFSKTLVQVLYNYMQANPDVGIGMPRVCYPDGSNQHLAKLLPEPGWLAVRLLNRLLPEGLVHRVNRKYELHDLDLDQPVQVPSLSGCFMFLRCEALRRAGLFDERFFLYFEDYDLVRRVGSLYKTVYYPELSITHDFARASRRSVRAFLHHVFSAVRYFNKWGWFSDMHRDSINNDVLSRVGKKHPINLD